MANENTIAELRRMHPRETAGLDDEALLKAWADWQSGAAASPDTSFAGYLNSLQPRAADESGEGGDPFAHLAAADEGTTDEDDDEDDEDNEDDEGDDENPPEGSGEDQL